MRFCSLLALACAAFQVASTLPVPNPIQHVVIPFHFFCDADEVVINSDHDDLDIRSTDFEVFEVRAKDNPLGLKVSGGSAHVYGHVGDIIVATVKTGIPSQSVKKPGKN
jgi:hypothetical protein